MAPAAMAAGRGQPIGGRIVRSLHTLRDQLSNGVALAYNDLLSLTGPMLCASTTKAETGVGGLCQRHSETRSHTCQHHPNGCDQVTGPQGGTTHTS